MRARSASASTAECLPPTCPLPQRWSREDGREDIARIFLGAGSPIDAALGQRLSQLRAAMRGTIMVVLERRTEDSEPEVDPFLRVGDALYFVGPPGLVRSAVGP